MPKPLRSVCAVLAAAASFSFASAAFAGAPDAHETIMISGTVPIVCRADVQGSASAASNGEVALGNLDEFCNDGAGYQVIASYQGGTDPGALVVGGRVVQLSSSGQSVIDSSQGPAIQQVSLAYQPGVTRISTLTISILAD